MFICLRGRVVQLFKVLTEAVIQKNASCYMLQSILPSMFYFMHVIDQCSVLLDDVAMYRGKGLKSIYCFAWRPCVAADRGLTEMKPGGTQLVWEIKNPFAVTHSICEAFGWLPAVTAWLVLFSPCECVCACVCHHGKMWSCRYLL